MNKYKYLLGNVLVFGLGNILSKIVSFFLLAVFTEYLTPQEFGDAELIVATISLLIPICTLCVSDASIRFLLERGNKQVIITNGFFITICGCIFLLFLYPLFTSFEFIHDYYCYILLLFFGSSIEQLLFGINKGFEKIKLCAFNSLVSVVTLVVCSYFFLIVRKMGIDGYLYSIIISHLLCCVYLFLGGNVYRYCRFSIETSVLKQMLIYGIPLIPSTIAWWVNTVSDRYLISLYLGSSFTGLYSVAAKIPNIISIVTTIFFQAWQISGIKEFGDKSYSTFYSNIYNVFTALIFSVSSIIIYLIPYIGDLLFKGQFISSWKYVPFLILGAIFSGLSGILSPAYQAAKKNHVLMVSTLAGATISILINILFLPKFGLQVATISTFLSFMSMWVIRLVLVRNSVKIKINMSVLIISIVSLLLQTVLLLLGRHTYSDYMLLICLIVLLVNFIGIFPLLRKLKSNILKLNSVI